MKKTFFEDWIRSPLDIIIDNSERLIEKTKDWEQNDFISNLQRINTANKHLLELVNDMPDSPLNIHIGFYYDLRTPLCPIISYSERLKKEAENLGRFDLVSDLQKIHATAKHLLNRVNNAFDLSKIEAGRMELYIEPVDLQAFLNDIVSAVQPLVAKKANTLEIEHPKVLGKMQTDRSKLRQMVLNLLSNAAKFTEQGTICLKVDLQTRINGKWLLFNVVDNGIGMTDEQQKNLFQPFTQVDTSATRLHGNTGIGIGLAISKRFAKMMGGAIEVNSEFERGSTFTLSLPRRG